MLVKNLETLINQVYKQTSKGLIDQNEEPKSQGKPKFEEPTFFKTETADVEIKEEKPY